MSNIVIPSQVAASLARLGQRIRIARLRRGWSVVELAEKAGINRNTLTALEQGKPGTAVGVCCTVLWALGLDFSLNAVADPDTDLHGKALEASRRPKRTGKRQKMGGAGSVGNGTENDYDF
ncbi:MAG: helix-turn-helix domain-containing protein [Zoogloeaceae bacterium]|jgi:transcriptional regulator with XRE-family HTH domain|nr:helix-turn-helix domain-containing protein [Zoogloeaceae bacterium]